MTSSVSLLLATTIVIVCYLQHRWTTSPITKFNGYTMLWMFYFEPIAFFICYLKYIIGIIDFFDKNINWQLTSSSLQLFVEIYIGYLLIDY